MINLNFSESIRARTPGSEPAAVTHDLHRQALFDPAYLDTLLQGVPSQSIKSKTAYQARNEDFNVQQLSRTDLQALLSDPARDVWVTLHEIEQVPTLRGVFAAMANALRSSLPPRYGNVQYCTGSLFISRGKASTPFHMDYGSNLLLQLAGEKRFLAYSPNDPEMVSKQSLGEFFRGEANPLSQVYDPSFDQRALTVELKPGLGVYMPSTSPHRTETLSRDLSITASLSFVSPLADQIRRASLFDTRLPGLRFLPDPVKYGVVAIDEWLERLKGHDEVRHKRFKRPAF